MSSSTPRRYFSARNARPDGRTCIDLETLSSLFKDAYDHFVANGYFAEAFGHSCVDGDVEGTVGPNVQAYVRMTIMKREIWPFAPSLEATTEGDLFDMVEFLFDHVSKPQQKDYHSWNDCGYHFSDFDASLGQDEFRLRLNSLLERYGAGYELNARGEIMELSPRGLKHLLHAQLPTKEATITEKVFSAIDRFRRYGSSLADRQQAVRDLADVLEWLRPQIKTTLLRKDEKELFQLANNFGIRHLNQNQKLDYDKAVWLSWMFYHYLATINACLHLLKRQSGQAALSAGA
ncbi:hypothetical protein ABDK56_03835 [Sphingomonas sp. ASV193]|uniref:hypothetical protein n=1 Tax=Sphingomonas sp. ASV193 TaxID=3144405 RepID=UPI0032E86589